MSSSYGSLAEVADRFLERGIVSSVEDGFICCPDCVKNNYRIYILSSVATFLRFVDAGNTINCCLHVKASVETTLRLQSVLGELPNSTEICSSNFNSCVLSLQSILSADGVNRILDNGLVEYGSLSGLSQVCRLKDFIELSYNSQPGDTTSTKSQITERILDKGIAIYCKDDEIVISSVDVFLTWLEAQGGGGAVPA